MHAGSAFYWGDAFKAWIRWYVERTRRPRGAIASELGLHRNSLIGYGHRRKPPESTAWLRLAERIRRGELEVPADVQAVLLAEVQL